MGRFTDEQLTGGKEHRNSAYDTRLVSATSGHAGKSILQLFPATIHIGRKLVAEQRTKLQNLCQQIRQPFLLIPLQFAEYTLSLYVTGKVVGRNLAKNHTVRQSVVVSLWRFLAKEYYRGIDFGGLYVVACSRTAFLLSIAIIGNGFQALEFLVGYLFVVVLLKNARHITETFQD